MTRISITIRADLLSVLTDLAIREHRTAQHQAAWLVERALVEIARSRQTHDSGEAHPLILEATP